MDPEFSNNVILTQTEFLTMNSRPKQPKYARNKNILVIGGSGSGKTRFFVKPNLMQMHSSYVVTDPKGTVLVECGKMLEKGGYVIKSLNTINFRKSMHYNPFSYIRSEKDILKLVNTIIVNTKGDGDKSGEDFWVKAEKLYYTALIGYIWYEAPDHEKNFTTLLEMINASEAREDDETFKNPVDKMFDELEARDPDHFAVKQYRKYKLAAGAAAQFPGRCADYRRRSFCRLHGTMAYGNKEFRGGDNFRLILQYGQKSNRAVFQRTADCIAGAVGKTHPGFLPEGTGTCERVLGYSLSRKHPQGVEVCCQARPNLQ